MNIPLNIDWQQILLHLFNFSILAGGLYFLLYNPVKNFMDQRAAYYEGMDKKAAASLEHATALEEEYKNRLNLMDEELDQKKVQAAKDMEAMADSVLAGANKQKEQIIRDAQLAAEREKQKIIQDAREEIIELAMTATRKMLSSEEVSHE